MNLTPEQKQRLLHEIIWAAEEIHKWGEDLRVELDYSPESLERLDQLKSELVEVLEAHEDGKASYHMMLGAYYGEVLRRNLGGEWDLDSWEAISASVRLDAKHWSFPFSTAKEWLDESEETFFWHFRAVQRMLKPGWPDKLH